MPEVPVDPGDSGNEAIALNGAQNRAAVGINLVNLFIAILAHPKGPSAQASPESPLPPGAVSNHVHLVMVPGKADETEEDKGT